MTVPASRGLWTPRWSPDGEHLLALTPNPNAYESTALWLFSFHTQKWKKLIDYVIDEPAWSHDGKDIYFNRMTATKAKVFRIGVHHPKLEELVDSTNFSHGVTWFGLAPDDSPLLQHNTRDYRIYALDVVW